MTGGGGGEVGKTEAELALIRTGNRPPPRRWDRGVWIRFSLAIAPTIVFAILGIILTHTS